MIAEIGSGISVSQNRHVENPVELPYLRVANVLRGHLDLGEIKTILVEKDRVPNYLLHVGDILFNEGGDRDKLGRGWVWEGQIPKCVHQNHVFRARLIDPSLINGKLVSHWGNTFGQPFFIKHGKQTTNLASINRTVLGMLPVPIAPIEEQAEILREVEHRLSAADRLAAALEQQLARTAATRKSLLSEAFAGRLVPQQPSDESASVLLERFQDEAHKSKGKRMQKSESKVQKARRPLIDVLREHKKPMSPEELFRTAGFQLSQVDDFYRELTVLREKLLEQKPKASEAKLWPNRAHVLLQLRKGAEK
jgi:type I restriction enzyme S subunit